MSPSTQTPPQRVITPPSPPADIPYERAVPWYARRRNFYLIVFLLLLNVVATTSISWGPIAVKEFQSRLDARRAAKAKAVAGAQQAAAAIAREQRAQAATDQAMAFAPPADHVCYTEDPAEAARLVAGKGYSIVPWEFRADAFPHPPVLCDTKPSTMFPLDVLSTQVTSDPTSTVFLHGRARRSDGEARLIWVTFLTHNHFESASYEQNGRQSWASRPVRRFFFSVIDGRGEHSTVWQSTLTLELPEDQGLRISAGPNGTQSRIERPGAALRVLAGRADSADASRWTLPFTLGGQPGVLNCRLRDDDRIDINAAEGGPTVTHFDSQSGELRWVIHLPPQH